MWRHAFFLQYLTTGVLLCYFMTIALMELDGVMVAKAASDMARP